MAGILIARNRAQLRDKLAEVKESWKPLEGSGLTLSTHDGRTVLSGELDGITCRVSVISDLVHYAHTKIVATPIPSAAKVELGVHPSPGGIMGKVRSWLGQDIEIGDEAFDAAFLVSGDPKSAPKAFLSDGIRENLTVLASGRLAGFTYCADEAVVLLHGVQSDPAEIAVALDVVTDAARWTI